MILLLAVIYVVFISLGLPDSLFGVAWPLVHTEFAIDEGFASVYSMLVGICSGGVTFIAGKLLRKYGTGKVTLASMMVTAIGLIGISFAPNIIVMMLFGVVLGYGAGIIDTGINTFVSLHYNAQHMNWLHCFWGVGVTISPLIMAQFLTEDVSSWRNGYKVVAVLEVAIALLVVATLKKWNVADSKAEKEETNEVKEKKMLEIIKEKGVITSILSLGFYCSMEFLVGTWGASFAVNLFAISPEEAAKWVSLYYGGIMLGRMLSGFVSMKVSDNNMVRGGLAIAFLGMIVLALPLGKTQLMGLLLIGFGFGPVFPSVLHSIPERFSRKYSADITGYHMGGAYTVGFCVQLLYGFAATRTTFFITAFVLIALCVCCFTCNERVVRVARKGN